MLMTSGCKDFYLPLYSNEDEKSDDKSTGSIILTIDNVIKSIDDVLLNSQTSVKDFQDTIILRNIEDQISSASKSKRLFKFYPRNQNEIEEDEIYLKTIENNLQIFIQSTEEVL